MNKEYIKDKKRKTAVAISYNPEDIAPKVIAKGKGYVAENIINKATQNNIKTYKDEKLVEELTRTDIGSHIPQELYLAVASVLVFINDLDRKFVR
ncbi:MAG: EscU/YscU/HrcU family type III secretion system export apparatus switch protein [Defluviitaleaceae bacterium]|nr:EscU/YscU/HrcU family type III secretion system export apparatus switch protein [Defluviitaleaceae bacterium]